MDPDPPPPPPAPSNWSGRSFVDVLSAKSSSTASGIIKSATSHKGEPAFIFSKDELDKLATPFRYALIGKFASGRPSMINLRKAFLTIGLVADYKLGLIDSRHLLIRLTSEEDFTRMWLKGVWHLMNFPMKVLKWTPNFQVNVEPSLVPVWISFDQLPAEYFAKEILYSFASSAGQPLKLDLATVNIDRPNVARVCVEIDLCKYRPKRIWIGSSEDGFWQSITYENLPSYCQECCKLGHDASLCRLSKDQPVQPPQQGGLKEVPFARDKGKQVVTIWQRKASDPINANDNMARAGPSSNIHNATENIVTVSSEASHGHDLAAPSILAPHGGPTIQKETARASGSNAIAASCPSLSDAPSYPLDVLEAPIAGVCDKDDKVTQEEVQPGDSIIVAASDSATIVDPFVASHIVVDDIEDSHIAHDTVRLDRSDMLNHFSSSPLADVNSVVDDETIHVAKKVVEVAKKNTMKDKTFASTTPSVRLQSTTTDVIEDLHVEQDLAISLLDGQATVHDSHGRRAPTHIVDYLSENEVGSGDVVHDTPSHDGKLPWEPIVSKRARRNRNTVAYKLLLNQENIFDLLPPRVP